MKVRERIPHIRFYMQGDPCLSRITLGIRLIWGIHSFTLILFVLGLYDIFFMYNSSFIINCPFRTPYSLCKLNVLCSLYCCRMQIEKRRCHHYYVCFVPAIKINILEQMANSRKQGNYHSIQWMLTALMLEVTLALTDSAHSVCLILLEISS